MSERKLRRVAVGGRSNSGFTCGCSTENLTRDHVPPSSWFIDPKPAMITVKACDDCNKRTWPGYSQIGAVDLG